MAPLMTRVLLLIAAMTLLVACDEKKVARSTTESAPGKPLVDAEGRCQHRLPPALCTKCNPSLVPVFQAKGDFCEDHGFPKSFCPTCNPGAEIPNIGATDPPADWCGGHGLPESQCTKCNPELIEKFKEAGDFCEEHGFPESVCPVCNPQTPPVRAAAADWCVEHGLPESKCTKCNPNLVQDFVEAGDFCKEHGFPESVCPKCNPQTPPAGAEKAAIEARVVRLQSPELERTAGFKTTKAKRTQAGSSVECTTQLEFDADRVADIRAIVPGVVKTVRIELGEEVKPGTPLFDLESTRVSEIQGALQQATERTRVAELQLERQQRLLATGATSQSGVELAEQELASAEAQRRAAQASLRMTGAAQAAPTGRYTLVSPLAGTVVRRPAVVGLLASENVSLATVADTSVMWAVCDVPETDASRVAIGQKVTVTPGGQTDQSFAGEVTWVAMEVDPRTRTVAARAELENPGGKLRANQFARARIETGATQSAVSVPRSAVQRVGDMEVVFVRTAPGVYEPRVVRRFGAGETVQVAGRIEEGEAVVTTGAVLLRTEIMPGSIGAGCCEAGAPGAD